MSTDWITEGAKVAVYEIGGFADSRAEVVTVERLTTTQVVLSNGARFRRDTGRVVGSGRTELRPVDDPQVRNAVALRCLASLRYRVDEACKDYRGNAADVLSTLAQIEQAVSAARAEIEG